jgi:hypothetical protein
MIKLHLAGTASRLYLYDYLFSRREPEDFDNKENFNGGGMI